MRLNPQAFPLTSKSAKPSSPLSPCSRWFITYLWLKVGEEEKKEEEEEEEEEDEEEGVSVKIWKAF